MRERPILFSGPMVRAILDGTKSQTRRVVKLPHQNPLGTWEPTRFGGPGGGRLASGAELPEQGAIWHTRTGETIACPYGQPGDRLWVRETWAPCPDHRYSEAFIYGADRIQRYEGERWTWKPSIHMPRRASRLTLTITDVRVERLHDISEADARAEGCPFDHDGKQYEPPANDPWQGYGRASFSLLWSKINGAASWDANPWVWVVSFSRAQEGK